MPQKHNQCLIALAPNTLCAPDPDRAFDTPCLNSDMRSGVRHITSHFQGLISDEYDTVPPRAFAPQCGLSSLPAAAPRCASFNHRLLDLPSPANDKTAAAHVCSATAVTVQDAGLAVAEWLITAVVLTLHDTTQGRGRLRFPW